MKFFWACGINLFRLRILKKKQHEGEFVGIIRTDLAVEAAEYHRSPESDTIPGVTQREYEREGCMVHQVTITSQQAAELLEKPVGTYVTLDLSPVTRRETDAFQRAVRAFSHELRSAVSVKKSSPVLVFGLGNRFVTPDSVGPRAADQILVTRHLLQQEPEHFAPFRPVSALSAGVLGTTGLESSELVQAVVKQTSPSLVLAVDALAARSVTRLCTTVQIGNTGIVPGSGVGNARNALNEETLGVPVIAIGVPTVVDAGTLAADLTGQEGDAALGSLLVTPKDIDTQVSDLSKVIAYGINLALQEGLDIPDIDLFLS